MSVAQSIWIVALGFVGMYIVVNAVCYGIAFRSAKRFVLRYPIDEAAYPTVDQLKRMRDDRMNRVVDDAVSRVEYYGDDA